MNYTYHILPLWHDTVFNVFGSQVLIRLNSRKPIGICLVLSFSFCFLFNHKTIIAGIFINTFAGIATKVQLMLWGQKRCVLVISMIYAECITELFNKWKTTNTKWGIKHLKIQFTLTKKTAQTRHHSPFKCIYIQVTAPKSSVLINNLLKQQ